MRTTVDIPNPLFRETKALAAMRGVTMKQFIIQAIQQAQNAPESRKAAPSKRRKFPSFHLRSGKKLDLSGFNFDDLLA
jgi:hypothetical protein